MNITEQILTIGLCALATIITRFLPFIIFSEKKQTPAFIQHIRKYLPSAVFGLLIIYCLKDVSLLNGSHGLPEFISIAVTVALHLFKRQILLSISGGTICFMLLTQFIF